MVYSILKRQKGMMSTGGKLVISDIVHAYIKFVKLPAGLFWNWNFFFFVFLLNIPFLWSVFLSGSTNINLVKNKKPPNISLFLIFLISVAHLVDSVSLTLCSVFSFPPFCKGYNKPSLPSCSVTINSRSLNGVGLLIFCPSNPSSKAIMIFLKFKYDHLLLC